VSIDDLFALSNLFLCPLLSLEPEGAAGRSVSPSYCHDESSVS
jgi:hypothetical protein